MGHFFLIFKMEKFQEIIFICKLSITLYVYQCIYNILIDYIYIIYLYLAKNCPTYRGQEMGQKSQIKNFRGKKCVLRKEKENTEVHRLNHIQWFN